jgi:hypothetical protein
MKKIYVKPATEVYEVEVQNVIAQTSVRLSTKSASKEAEVDADERSSWGSLW